MEKYILGEIFTSGGATLYKNPYDQTVSFSPEKFERLCAWRFSRSEYLLSDCTCLKKAFWPFRNCARSKTPYNQNQHWWSFWVTFYFNATELLSLFSFEYVVYVCMLYVVSISISIFQEKDFFFCYLDHPSWASYLLVKAILWSDEPSPRPFREVPNQRSLHLPTDFFFVWMLAHGTIFTPSQAKPSKHKYYTYS